MLKNFSIAQIFLWLFVINLGLVIGGGLYEQLVVMPLWSLAPPDSVIAFYRHNAANSQFALDQGGRFWIFVMPLAALLSIATLLSGLRTRPEHRRWRVTAAILALIMIIFTFVWFVPNIILLMGEGVLKMNPEEVGSLAKRWVELNWVRGMFFWASWLAALRALSVSPKIEDKI